MTSADAASLFNIGRKMVSSYALASKVVRAGAGEGAASAS